MNASIYLQRLRLYKLEGQRYFGGLLERCSCKGDGWAELRGELSDQQIEALLAAASQETSSSASSRSPTFLLPQLLSNVEYRIWSENALNLVISPFSAYLTWAPE